MAFHFEKPSGFNVKPGQFADVTLTDPPEVDAEGNTRIFSIASPPFENELVFTTRMRDTAFKRVHPILERYQKDRFAQRRFERKDYDISSGEPGSVQIVASVDASGNGVDPGAAAGRYGIIANVVLGRTEK